MDEPDVFGEVEFGLAAAEMEGCLVIGPGGVLCLVEGAEPDSGRLEWVADFSCPFSPWPVPHASVSS